METRWKIIGFLALVVTLTLLFLPKLVPICSALVATASGGQMPMRCYFTFRAQSLLALTGLFTAATIFFTRNKEARMVTGIVMAVIGIMMFILPLPGISGICRHDHAACQNTAFWNCILSSFLILLGLLVMFLKTPSSVNPSIKDDEQRSAGEKTKWLD